MRLTVGPLPPAVYWRRRAVVLGGVLLVVVLLVYACNGPDGSNASTKNANATMPPPSDVASAATGPDDTAATDTSSGTSADEPQSPTATATDPTDPPDSSFCTDDELQVTPVPAASKLRRGATTQITIKIKNKSKRTCKRDVGADQQELYIVEAGTAHKIWSSDDCGGRRGSNVASFTPGFERSYVATWNGRESTNCKDRPLAEIGEYQLYGRLGTKRSAPVTITIS